jgi:hypothetical protein
MLPHFSWVDVIQIADRNRCCGNAGLLCKHQCWRGCAEGRRECDVTGVCVEEVSRDVVMFAVVGVQDH